MDRLKIIRDWGGLADLKAMSSTGYSENVLSRLTKCSLTGASAALRQKMLDDKFVLEGIAILGQWTTLYAAPNAGKTLLTNWLLREAIEANEIESEMVYYINADDHYRGLVEKTELAEEWCMHMIAPHHNDFSVSQIPEMMLEMAKDGSANGVIFILDTLKKFTDLMDKRAASDFGMAARGFVSAGGTLIALAHTNKHKNSEGKAVYSGTSDIVDDSDCCYVIDKISEVEKDGRTLHTVEFTNIKARGDVEPTLGFTYEKQPRQAYIELLDSVKRIGSEDVSKVRAAVKAKEKLVDDEPVIEAVCAVIAEGTNTKDELVKAVKDRTNKVSVKLIKQVLEQRTGHAYFLGDRWTVRKGAHNRHEYAVLHPPS